ncbi:aminotransferase class-V [Truncatella angustata]|uniref:Aminotransferase class-V n=1 Tax=Truncatella angustata TaxID=152316 RepID=A0A9P9A475_9PEZI|nr:aminotransferase class-V [Truncatella angustata]KAH6660005.1 aminotransferase class-V [Truncatella angustata]
MAPFDVQSARSKFPALQQEQVYFDNAGGSQTLGAVIDSIYKYLTTNNVQLGASYRVGKASTQKYNEGFAAAAKYINAQEDEIVFGSSTTQLYRNLSYALHFEEGDEIIVSSIDHEANIAPWVDLASRLKLNLRWWTPAKSTNPKLLAEDLKPLLTPRTRLVTCTHTSNILGTITDVKAIAETVHTVPGALLCVDGVAYAPHRALDMQDLGADFYCYSWYKVYGPHISMLYASRGAQEARVRSLGHFFKGGSTLDERLGLAGGSYELLQTVPAVLGYLGASGSEAWEGLRGHEEELQGTLLEYLNGREDVTVIGEPSSDPALRVPTVSFVVKGWNSQELVEKVEKDSNFAFRWGSFYSNRLVHELLGLGSDGVVRISMVHYNTVEEVKGIIGAIDAAIQR